MKVLCIVAIILGLLSNAEAQVNLNVNLSGKHRSKILSARDAQHKLKRYKKIYDKEKERLEELRKDSIQAIEEKKQIDSAIIIAELPDSTHINNELFTLLSDSASYEDSLQWALNTLAAYNQWDEIDTYLEKVSILDSGYLHRIDSFQLDQTVDQIARKYITPLPSKRNLESKVPADRLPSNGKHNLQQQLLNDLPLDLTKSPTEQIDMLQQKVNQKVMTEMQGKLMKLKKKYVYLPDINDPSSGIKRKSLKGQPIIDRLHLGGNFTVQSTSPLMIDTDIQLGYKFDKDLTIGIGLTWRESFGNKKDSSQLLLLSRQSHGYSFFASHTLFRNIFAYGEYAALRNNSLINPELGSPAKWQYEIMLGVGREFHLWKFMDMTVTVLYDFNYRNNDLHPLPVIVKIGYQFRKLGLFNKNKSDEQNKLPYSLKR